jgi:PTS system nitrogen regulatory IIA component
MDVNSLYQVYFNCELKTKEEVYSFISDIVCRENHSKKEEVIDQLNEREKVGSILIAEHVMLPHIESDQIKRSQILFIRLAHPILSWNSQTKDIRLLIVILLKENENEQIKKKISLFTRNLADEAHITRLLNINTEENFYQEINKQ